MSCGTQPCRPCIRCRHERRRFERLGYQTRIDCSRTDGSGEFGSRTERFVERKKRFNVNERKITKGCLRKLLTFGTKSRRFHSRKRSQPERTPDRSPKSWETRGNRCSTPYGWRNRFYDNLSPFFLYTSKHVDERPQSPSVNCTRRSTHAKLSLIVWNV